MGQAAEDTSLAAALLAHRLLGRSGHALMKDGEALPSDRRLERLAQHAHGDEHVAQIWSAQKCAPPGAHRVLAGPGPALRRGAAVLGTQLECSHHRSVHWMIGGLEAKYQQCVRAV